MSETIKPIIEFDLDQYLAFLRKWIDDLMKKASQQAAEIAILKSTLADIQRRLVDEGPAIAEGSTESGHGPVSAETRDPFRGIERRIEAVLEPEELPADEEEGWREIRARLLAAGISQQDMARIKEAMRRREKGLVDTQGRERLRLLVRGNQPHSSRYPQPRKSEPSRLFQDNRDGTFPVRDPNDIP